MHRMITLFAVFSLILTVAGEVYAQDGLINLRSVHEVKATADRMERIIKEKGLKVFLRIDHAAGARSVGAQLRPTELIIFGNPKTGSALMACTQTFGIDLPLKALIWQDKEGQVWLTYNDPKFLAARQGIGDCAGPVIGKMEQMLSQIAVAAAEH